MQGSKRSAEPHCDGIVALVLAPEARARTPIAGAPQLSHASGEILREIEISDEYGDHRRVLAPVERPLAVLLDQQPVATLWTLGASAEWLVLGYLHNQQLLSEVTQLASITVDWDTGTALVKTRNDAERHASTAAPQGAAILTGLGRIGRLHAPRISRSALLRILANLPRENAIYRAAGSVHGCALLSGGTLWIGVEDVSRRNAIDIVSGWMALHGVPGGDKVLFTTGRLTSEIIKAALSGVPCVVSRKGVTAMCCELAEQLGITLFGHAAQGRYLCYAGGERFDPNS